MNRRAECESMLDELLAVEEGLPPSAVEFTDKLDKRRRLAMSGFWCPTEGEERALRNIHSEHETRVRAGEA